MSCPKRCRSSETIADTTAIFLLDRLRSAATAVASSDSTPAPPTPPSRAPAAEKAHAGQSISLDMLFGSSPTSTVSIVPSKAHETTSQQAPANPLDLLFLNAARNSPQIQSRQPPSQQEDQARSKPPPQPQQQISGIPKTLEQLFAAASPIPQSASLPFQSLSQAHLSAPSPRMLPNPLPKSSASSANGSGQGNNASPGMSLLDAIFASASTGNDSVCDSPYTCLSLPRIDSINSLHSLSLKRYRNLDQTLIRNLRAPLTLSFRHHLSFPRLILSLPHPTHLPLTRLPDRKSPIIFHNEVQRCNLQ